MKNYQLISLILCFLMTITAIKSWPEPINIHQLVHLFIKAGKRSYSEISLFNSGHVIFHVPLFYVYVKKECEK